MTTHALADTRALTGRSLRHVLRSPDTIITTAVTPIALMLLVVSVRGGALATGGGEASMSGGRAAYAHGFELLFVEFWMRLSTH